MKDIQRKTYRVIALRLEQDVEVWAQSLKSVVPKKEKDEVHENH